MAVLKEPISLIVTLKSHLPSLFQVLKSTLSDCGIRGRSLSATKLLNNNNNNLLSL